MKKRCTSYISLYSKKIPEDVQTELMLLDPTGNECTYIDWIFKQYLLGLKTEDYYKLSNSLREFHKEKDRIPKELRDINKYKTYNNLMDMLDEQLHKVDITIDQSNTMLGTDPDIELIYDGHYGTLSIPKTEEASCKLGKGTRWCTAAEESDNMFNEYNESGSLYVWYDRNWNKGIMKELGNKSKKFQFHFPSCQFMDERDNNISSTILSYFRNDHPVLSQIFNREEENMQDDELIKYVSYIDDREGPLFMRAYEQNPIEVLRMFKVSSFNILNKRNDLDELVDQDDERYLYRCILFPNYINKNKIWTDMNIKSYYDLMISKYIAEEDPFLSINPYHRLYYATYISRKRDIYLENISFPWPKPKYIDTKLVLDTYIMLYSDSRFALKVKGNTYVFSTDYLSNPLNNDELEFMKTHISQDELYNFVPSSKEIGMRNIYKLCISGPHVRRNKYMDELVLDEMQSFESTLYDMYHLYCRDISHRKYTKQLQDIIDTDNNVSVFNSIYISQFRYLTDREFNTVKNGPITEDEMDMITSYNYITADQLKELFNIENQPNNVKMSIVASIAKKGDKKFILDNISFITKHADIKSYIEVWKLLYTRQSSELIENLLVPMDDDNSNKVRDASDYFSSVRSSPFIERCCYIPFAYLNSH